MASQHKGSRTSSSRQTVTTRPKRGQLRSAKPKLPAKLVAYPVTLSELQGFKIEKGILLPRAELTPVPSGKLVKGLVDLRAQLHAALSEMSRMATAEYGIKELHVEVSFSAEGKFLGFGVGGAATFKLLLVPKP
jgi:hypothetical protein